MNPDDDVCLCFHVSLRKIGHFIRRTQPQVPSQISECLGGSRVEGIGSIGRLRRCDGSILRRLAPGTLS